MRPQELAYRQAGIQLCSAQRAISRLQGGNPTDLAKYILKTQNKGFSEPLFLCEEDEIHR